MLKETCTFLFKLSGWKFENTVPDDLRSFILLGAPHTSNHDFLPAMAMAYLMKRNAKFVIKKEWLKFPLNLIMKPAGAIGIDRNKLKEGAQSNTDAMAALFDVYPELVLMITPEGTRARTAKWKTGFYYIAQKAHVPIVLGYADFEKKIAGFGPVIYPKNLEEDMRTIMNFYSTIRGKRPDHYEPDARYRE